MVVLLLQLSTESADTKQTFHIRETGCGKYWMFLVANDEIVMPCHSAHCVIKYVLKMFLSFVFEYSCFPLFCYHRYYRFILLSVKWLGFAKTQQGSFFPSIFWGTYIYLAVTLMCALSLSLKNLFIFSN